MSTIYIALIYPLAIRRRFIGGIFWVSVGWSSSYPYPYLLKKLGGINIDGFYDFLIVSIRAFLRSPFGVYFVPQFLDSYS